MITKLCERPGNFDIFRAKLSEPKLCNIKFFIWSKTYLDQILSLNNRVLFRRLRFDKIRKSIVLLQFVLFLDTEDASHYIAVKNNNLAYTIHAQVGFSWPI